MIRILIALCLFTTVVTSAIVSSSGTSKKVMIIIQGDADMKNLAMGVGRQLGALMGHFNVQTEIRSDKIYSAGDIERFENIFYIGYDIRNTPPTPLLNDLFSTSKSVVWIGSGMIEFGSRFDVKRKFGFSVTGIDSLTHFNTVTAGGKIFAREELTTELIRIENKSAVSTLATAVDSKNNRQTPYIIRSKNLLYVADSPFAYAGDNDRYLYFADLLHDILGEQHDESHSAYVRIEDIDLNENPVHLRTIADILSAKGIPFMVGVIPFYVNPDEGIRLSLSDRPELVDALRYMVRNGGTIVMHGSTHQYKGTTATDFEFWDESVNRPIKDESIERFSQKIEDGIDEFTKNGLYPLVWETPHYTGSQLLYQTVAKYFSTVFEQRLAIDDADYSQYFPYIINKDMYGQTIIPENLGYIPFNPSKEESRKSVHNLLTNARTQLSVRDGVSAFFFHAFLDLDLLKEIVDGLESLGYTFPDIREQALCVKTKNRIILTGEQEYSLPVYSQFLVEKYFTATGELRDRQISNEPLQGTIRRRARPGRNEIYTAELTDASERQPNFFEDAAHSAKQLVEKVFTPAEQWGALRPVILWNHYARGSAYTDQASLASVFGSVNIRVDTIFVGQTIDLSSYNLVIVPFAFVDSLRPEEYDILTAFVDRGGHLITDTRNELAKEMGIQFLSERAVVGRIREKLFPEERVVWRYSEQIYRIGTGNIDEIFAVDELSGTAMAVGKKIGKGKIIYINSRFDPHSELGYSHYPFLLEYVRRFFELRPFVRRDQLELYFDPGFRHAMSVEQLMTLWVRWGVRTLHVSAWHQYQKYTYDYTRLITLAHANGIKCFAWIEPPQVSQLFYSKYPQWREINFKGEEVRPSWRYPVAMTDPACAAAMRDTFAVFLRRHDWDGVNLAELYFEAGRGFKDPNLFTPLHQSARSEVQAIYGFDPVVLFQPNTRVSDSLKTLFVNYRIEKLDRLYRMLLGSFETIKQERNGFEVIVTAMDSYGSPELKEYIGVDMDRLTALQNEFGFSLVVEDPEHQWSTDPMRYRAIGDLYASRVTSRNRLMLDLNIMKFRKPESVTPFPTLIQTGTEAFHLVRAAALGAPRQIIYSESSVNPQDSPFLANALAADVHYNAIQSGFEFDAPYSFTLELPEEIPGINLDGSLMPPFRKNQYIIPAGMHRVTFGTATLNSFSANTLSPRIVSFTGNILELANGMREVRFKYMAEGRSYASFSHLPTGLTIDGEAYPFTVLKGDDCYTIRLPEGTHTTVVVTGDQFSYGINVASLWSSTTIALFGSLAVLLLVIMYGIIRLSKRKNA